MSLDELEQHRQDLAAGQLEDKAPPAPTQNEQIAAAIAAAITAAVPSADAKAVEAAALDAITPDPPPTATT
jgi:hypothetical protein